jgi:hypothetical protein
LRGQGDLALAACPAKSHGFARENAGIGAFSAQLSGYFRTTSAQPGENRATPFRSDRNGCFYLRLS